MLNDLSDIEDDPVDQLSAVLEKKVSISNEYRLEFGDCLEKMNELPPQVHRLYHQRPPLWKDNGERLGYTTRFGKNVGMLLEGTETSRYCCYVLLFFFSRSA